MDGNGKNNTETLDCRHCREGLQEYLDGSLPKKQSLAFFLHLRECDACQAEHDRLQGLFQLLDALPPQPVPEGFDEKVMAAIPLQAYRDMEPIRRARVPVFLEEDALPQFVRSPVTRVSGLIIAAAGATAVWGFSGPQMLVALGAAGLIPEFLVRIQGLGRWATLVVRRTES